MLGNHVPRQLEREILADLRHLAPRLALYQRHQLRRDETLRIVQEDGCFAHTRYRDQGGLVRMVLEATNVTAAPLRPPEREAMHRRFVTTSRYEWMFWDMGYRREAWPL